MFANEDSGTSALEVGWGHGPCVGAGRPRRSWGMPAFKEDTPKLETLLYLCAWGFRRERAQGRRGNSR